MNAAEKNPNKEKKVLFNFIKANLIDRLLKDKAEVERRNKSSIAEQIILDSLLPANKDARDIVVNYLYSDDNPIGNTLSAIFSYNAAGTDWKSKNDNLLPLVQFAQRQLVFSSIPLNGDEPDIYHCVSQIDTIITILNKLAEEKKELASSILHDSEFASTLLKDLKERPEQVNLSNFYLILINNWEYLKDSTFTYRLLRDLTILEKGWRDYSDVRVELLQILKDISTEWK